MKKISLPKVNCFTLSNGSTLGTGLNFAELEHGTRGVLLSPRSSATRRGNLASADLLAKDRFGARVASIDAQGFLCPWDGQREIVVLTHGVYEIEHLHGAIPTAAWFHDESLSLGGLDGSTFCRGRTPAPVLLRLSWAPRDGHFHDAPAVRLRRHGGEAVVGLSSVERLRNGWPVLWCRTLREYDRIMSESAKGLDDAFLRYGSARRLME
jgi:hypothetical protein